MRDSHLATSDVTNIQRKTLPAGAEQKLPQWQVALLVIAISGAISSCLLACRFNLENYSKANAFSWRSSSPSQTDYLGRAKHILRSTPLIDGHNDFPFVLRAQVRNKIYGLDFQSMHLLSHTDLFKMKQGILGGQFWSVWVPCPGQLEDENPGMINFSQPASSRNRVPQIDEPSVCCFIS